MRVQQWAHGLATQLVPQKYLPDLGREHTEQNGFRQQLDQRAFADRRDVDPGLAFIQHRGLTHQNVAQARAIPTVSCGDPGQRGMQAAQREQLRTGGMACG